MCFAYRSAYPFVLPEPTSEEFPVHYLRLISIGMTIAGAALAVAANVFDLGGALTLIGLMLVVAGLVKIVTVAVWNGFAGLGPVQTTEDGG